MRAGGKSTLRGRITLRAKPGHHYQRERTGRSIDDFARDFKTAQFTVAGDELEAVMEIAKLVFAKGADRLCRRPG